MKWCILRPKRLPRGFSNIIAGVLYHPPGANNIAMKEHLKSSLEIIETHYPNSGIVLAGDFNQLDFKSTAKLFNLKPAINFPTRGTNTLDQIRFLQILKTFIIQQKVVHRLAYLTMSRSP
jgi:hypothetical protein